MGRFGPASFTGWYPAARFAAANLWSAFLPESWGSLVAFTVEAGPPA
jgi:hypothetical protein